MQIRFLIIALLIPFRVFSQGIPEKDTIRIPVDTTKTFVKIWNLTEDFAVMRDRGIDTMKTQFQIYDPVFRNSIASAFIGNTGLQTQNLIYFNQEKQPGFYSIQWDGKDAGGRMVGSGIYIVHMKSGNYAETKKIAVVK